MVADRPNVILVTTVLPGQRAQQDSSRDPLLRRSFHAAGQPASSLVRAGWLMLWLQLNVPSFRPVLARGWHWPHCLRIGYHSLDLVAQHSKVAPVLVLAVPSASGGD